MKKILINCFTLLALTGYAYATASTQLWNPSTDIQAFKTWHVGIDNYFTQEGPSSGGSAFPTDVGLTYGLLPGLEVGADIMLPQDKPLSFNLKYGIAEDKNLPVSMAIGIFGIGTDQTNSAASTGQNVAYGVIAKNFAFGRFSVGYFSGNENLLKDPEGNADNKGLILTYDKSLLDNLWVCVDYAGSRSVLGSTFYGAAWTFSSNTSIILGYGTYNNGAKPTITTQLDINL